MSTNLPPSTDAIVYVAKSIEFALSSVNERTKNNRSFCSFCSSLIRYFDGSRYGSRFCALENPLYTYLAGGVGKSKRWVPCDKAYGVGQCSGPVMYCNPDNVMNEAGGADTNIGINHMVPNWDPGFQSWLIPEDSPYMNSYMEFSLDDVNGCTITEYRGDEGATYNGKWNLNVSDNAHPTLSFTDAFSMHNTGFDAVCDNYTTNIVITELSEYMLQLATMRTNSEGAWWIIWNFIAEDVKNGTVKIPSGEKER